MNKLTERQEGVRGMAIEYIRVKKLYDKYHVRVLDFRSRNILMKFWEEDYRLMEYYEDQCLSVDISLGLAVEEGDYEAIPEYREAIKIG